MKVTKSTLKKIIKEELSNVLQEMDIPFFGDEPEEEEPGAMHGGYEVGTFTPGEVGEEARSMTTGMAGAEEMERGMEQAERKHVWNRPLPGDRAAAKAEINKMRQEGKIDRDTWRAARRALYRSQAEAQQILDDATGGKEWFMMQPEN